MDFLSDSLMGVRKFRTFNVMDDCTREALAIEIDTSLSSKRIIRALEGLCRMVILKGLTESTAKPFSMLTSLPIYEKYEP